MPPLQPARIRCKHTPGPYFRFRIATITVVCCKECAGALRAEIEQWEQSIHPADPKLLAALADALAVRRELEVSE